MGSAHSITLESIEACYRLFNVEGWMAATDFAALMFALDDVALAHYEKNREAQEKRNKKPTA